MLVKNRIVPIPDLIFGTVNIMYSLAKSLHSVYLFLDSNMRPMTHDKYRHRFKRLLYDIGIKSEHRLHDCRKMFITLAKDCGMDEYALKKIVGHAVTDIAEAIYTDRSYEWLYKEMNKVQKKYNVCKKHGKHTKIRAN